MSFELNQALPPAGLRRGSKFLLRLLLSTTVVAIWPSALESALADDPTTQQTTAQNQQPEKNKEPELSASPAAASYPWLYLALP